MNILIAEDEQDIRELLGLHLIKEDYIVYEASNGIEALDVFNKNDIDLAILDIMMPGLDGFKVLKKIREKSNIPVIFITARGEDENKILGLGLGADDYIVKPFSPMEVVARVKAIFRRIEAYSQNDIDIAKNNKIKNGKLLLDKDACTLYKNGNSIELNAKEYKIMEFLMENKGRIHTKKQIYERVWGYEYYGDANTIMVHISHIRDKIEDNPKEPVYLKTIRGIGYKLEKVE